MKKYRLWTFVFLVAFLFWPFVPFLEEALQKWQSEVRFNANTNFRYFESETVPLDKFDQTMTISGELKGLVRKYLKSAQKIDPENVQFSNVFLVSLHTDGSADRVFMVLPSKKENLRFCFGLISEEYKPHNFLPTTIYMNDDVSLNQQIKAELIKAHEQYKDAFDL